MNLIHYKNDYKKKHYVRKEICFKIDEWEKVYNYLLKNKTTLKEIILKRLDN